VLVDDVEVRPPSLDDVFFALTGRPVDDAPPVDDAAPQLEGATS
jgi:hypothetical protein